MGTRGKVCVLRWEGGEGKMRFGKWECSLIMGVCWDNQQIPPQMGFVGCLGWDGKAQDVLGLGGSIKPPLN